MGKWSLIFLRLQSKFISLQLVWNEILFQQVLFPGGMSLNDLLFPLVSVLWFLEIHLAIAFNRKTCLFKALKNIFCFIEFHWKQNVQLLLNLVNYVLFTTEEILWVIISKIFLFWIGNVVIQDSKVLMQKKANWGMLEILA